MHVSFIIILVLFITKGTMVAGGVSKVYEYNKNTGRLDMFKYVKLF